MSGANRIRRITKDQLNLRVSPPLDYLFFDSPNSSASSLNEDITTVDVFLLGPAATAYENGVFRVSLKLGSTYPNEPPTACFRTKIFHPNINESNGDVCVDTLKNGWTSQLNLVDVLSTMRCLLIHPNPSSALNSEAALLADTDYKAFEKQAKLFTKIYAAVPPEMKAAVEEAREARTKNEGESTGGSTKAKRPQKADRSASIPTLTQTTSSSSNEKKAVSAIIASPTPTITEDKDGEEKEKEEEEVKTDDSGKENTTSGHANNAAPTTTSTPKRPVSKKRTSDAVFEKSTSTMSKTTTTTTAATTNSATKKRSEPSSNGASAPVAKKVLRSDTRKLSRENSSGSIGKGRSVSSGARKGLKRL